MNSFLIAVAKFVTIPIAALLTFAGYNIQQPKVVNTTTPSQIVVGAFTPTGGGTYHLKNSIGLSNTSINLSSFKEPISNLPYTMTYLSTAVGYGTLDPQTPTKSEFISFTGITQNSDGSAQLTGVTRGLSRTPGTGGCVASTTLAISHSGQSIFIMSNSPCFYNEYAVKRNDETITGSWTVPAPTAGGNPTTKTYVDGLVSGGTVSYDKIAVAATAGETVSAGQVLYQNTSDGRWYKAGIATPLASTTILGIAQGSGVSAGVIASGVVISGLDTNQSGLTIGANYFLGPTAGTISTATSTRIVGKARTATNLYFNTSFQTDGLFTVNGGTATTKASLVLSTTTATAPSNIASTSIVTFTGSGTWTKQANLRYAIVELVGGGGGGGSESTTFAGGGGGGGGGYCKKIILASALGATETVTIGAAGAAGVTAAGGTGGTTSFGSHCQATGGLGGGRGANNSAVGTGGVAGVGSGGNINIGGQGGGAGGSSATEGNVGGVGGSSQLGGGGSGVTDNANSVSPSGGYGGGGGGGVRNAGGEISGAAGAAGVVIVTEIYF